MSRIRIGQGVDVHAFASDGDHLMLAGVRIEHDRGVAAHSDGDVALHAVCDALLGAAGLGDIGVHFPPGEERWRDADSRDLLRRVHGLLRSAGWQPVNIDLTIVCEAPRIGPHTAAMRQCVAADLDLEPEDISVKATTTEGLGLTGRGEGIAAVAGALIADEPATDGSAA